jgi:hypothetical protein
MHLFFQKIDPRLPDGRVEPVEVFEQPQAGATVDGGYVERDGGDGLAGKVKQLPLHVGQVQKSQPGTLAGCLAGAGVEVVVLAKPVAAQNLVHCLAPFAAKVFFVETEAVFEAVAAAVVAARQGYRSRRHGHEF